MRIADNLELLQISYAWWNHAQSGAWHLGALTFPASELDLRVYSLALRIVQPLARVSFSERVLEIRRIELACVILDCIRTLIDPTFRPIGYEFREDYVPSALRPGMGWNVDCRTDPIALVRRLTPAEILAPLVEIAAIPPGPFSQPPPSQEMQTNARVATPPPLNPSVHPRATVPALAHHRGTTPDSDPIETDQDANSKELLAKVPGVSYDKSKANWEASWQDVESGKRVKRCFAESRYGHDEARRLAIETRMLAEEEGRAVVRQSLSRPSVPTQKQLTPIPIPNSERIPMEIKRVLETLPFHFVRPLKQAPERPNFQRQYMQRVVDHQVPTPPPFEYRTSLRMVDVKPPPYDEDSTEDLSDGLNAEEETNSTPQTPPFYFSSDVFNLSTKPAQNAMYAAPSSPAGSAVQTRKSNS